MGVICCYGLNNYGRGDCTTIIDEIVGIIQVPLKNGSGIENKIALASPFTSVQVNALLLNADRKARWYPFPRLYGVTLPIADTVFDEATDGQKSFVREGIWSFAGETRDKDAVPPMLKKMKAAKCSEWGAYLVTKSNQLVGELSVDKTSLYPLRVNESSSDPKMMFKDATATNKIMVAFDFSNLVKQENLYVITGEEVGVDFNRLQKLTDVTLLSGNVTTTSIQVSIKSSFAQGLYPNNDIVGLNDGVTTDIVLYNETDASAITVLTSSESPTVDGLYTLTFAAQSSADVITVSMNIPDTFYEGSIEVVVP